MNIVKGVDILCKENIVKTLFTGCPNQLAWLVRIGNCKY